MEDLKCQLDGVEEPDWRSNPNNGLMAAIIWNTIPKEQKYIHNPGETKPTIENKSFEPEFISEEIKDDPKAPILVDCQRVLVPNACFTPVTEELRNRPSIRALQAAVKNGAVLEISLKPSSAIIWNTIPKEQKYIHNPGEIKPTIENKSFEPEFISEEIKDDPKAPILVDCQRVLVPNACFTPVTEELRNRPSIRALQAAVKNGAVLEISLKPSSGIIVLPKE